MQNATDDVVYVFWFDDGEEERIGPIQPDTNGHLPVQYPEECSSGILIARTSAGREIDRRTEPLCRNDTWVIRCDQVKFADAD